MARFQLPDIVRHELESKIDALFDRLTHRFVGTESGKTLRFIYGTTLDPILSLPGIFHSSARDAGLPLADNETLKSLARVSANYITATRERTKARLLNEIDNALASTSHAVNPEDVLAELQAKLGDWMNKASFELTRVLETESSNAMNTGLVEGIKHMSASMGIEDPVVFKITVPDNLRCEVCKKLWLMEDGVTPRLYKLSELRSGYMDHKHPSPVQGPTHPHCLTSKKSMVLTEDKGWLRIDKINAGDRVLTSKGRFKAVTGDLKDRTTKYTGLRINIQFKTAGNDKSNPFTSITTTPEHLMLTARGWIRADQLIIEDTLKALQISCPVCSKKHRIDHKKSSAFCSKSCWAKATTKKQWANPEHRANISQKTSDYVKKQWADNPLDNPYVASIKKANTATRQLIKENKMWFQQDDQKEILRQKMINLNASRLTTVSKPQRQLYEIVQAVYPDAVLEYPQHHWTLDIAIPSLKINVEFDGGGHFLQVKLGKATMDQMIGRDKGRDVYLAKCGWHIVRYTKIPSAQALREDLLRLAANNNGEYSFCDIGIKKIKIITGRSAKENPVQLYDIKVEDDESFIVNGVVSHNCRCSLTYLQPGFGFSSSGSVEFKSIGWDEYKNQRG